MRKKRGFKRYNKRKNRKGSKYYLVARGGIRL